MQYYYVNAGHGTGEEELNSFDDALLDAGVGNYNLVRVSSILPIGAHRKKQVDIEKGNILHAAYAAISSNIDGDIIAAAIAIGVPNNNTDVGVIMEYASHCTKECAEEKVISMVEKAMSVRKSCIKKIVSNSAQCRIEDGLYHTAFAVVALW